MTPDASSHIFDRGHGEPVVVVPGIQGRWEWMRPGVEALAERRRVITFSLADEPSAHYLSRAERAAMPAAGGFGLYVEQIARAMDDAGVARAAICGVSFGGLIAATFAARHPDRVTALVLASALPPSWTLDARARFYLRAPRLLAPLFCLSSLRLYKEIAAAGPGFWHGISAALGHGLNVATHPFDARRMARRALLATGLDAAVLRTVQVPTLLVTGEPSLERVVAPSLTLEYQRVWPHARHVTLTRTGHLGIITRPREFASIVTSFLDEHARDAPTRRRVG
jgi:pimeloyl-ACP methyl ester carboxylesterase